MNIYSMKIMSLLAWVANSMVTYSASYLALSEHIKEVISIQLATDQINCRVTKKGGFPFLLCRQSMIGEISSGRSST